MPVHYLMAETVSGYREQRLKVDEECLRLIGAGTAARAMNRQLTIKCVVHVVYCTDDENISDAQVKSQIKVLNQDFSASNPDRKNIPGVWQGLVADAKIAFELAKTDPSGKRTSGITRTKTAVKSFGVDDSVKSSKVGGVDPWTTTKYLNFWVCALGQGLLGYGQFPGGPAKTDGVVILNQAFGTTGTAAAPFDRGRTATHEIGHFLNLRHIWGDRNDCTGSDRVSDTPAAKEPNGGVPTFPHISCNNGPNGDMFMNYMDYVDDAAMFMFTPGQVERMNATLAGPRKGLVG